MQVHYFTEMAHHTFPDEAAERYPSMRIVFPNTYFDRKQQHELYKRYFDEYAWAEECGWDGVMVNEHHMTPSCSNVSVNLSAAVLARITKRVKILLLGNLIPVHENPVYIAEQIAMVDQISGGRVVSGFVRGIGIEYWWANVNPVYSRERFQEAHDLILKCWTTPGPFRWEGKHYHFRHVNPWVLPYQQPHPPIWVPGSASPETAEWAGRMGYT
ncbi:MAG TPA: LLM class flavin-dependent oxidoreductase, partial [Bacillota bacterium]